MDINQKNIDLPKKSMRVLEAMETRGWKYRIRNHPNGAQSWIDFYKIEDCVSVTTNELGDNWLLSTLAKYDPEIKQATIDASFTAMCEILKKSKPG